MELPHIPQDDLMDVLEMTKKMEFYFSTVLEDTELNLAISALMNASINSILRQCDNLEEILFYRNLYIKMFDNSVTIFRL